MFLTTPESVAGDLRIPRASSGVAAVFPREVTHGILALAFVDSESFEPFFRGNEEFIP